MDRNRRTAKGLLACLLLAALPAQADGFFTDRGRGWFWYEQPPKPAKPVPKKPVSKPQDPVAQLKAFQRELESAKAAAVMNPTPANLKRYMALQQQGTQQAARFADQWRRVVWSTPSLDYTVQHPVNAVGLAIAQPAANDARRQAARQLAQTDGIFFFFRSDCPYCEAQAPILARLANTYGIRIMPISLDGGTLPEFPNARTDNGWAQRLNVTVTPTMYMVNPKTKQIEALGFGLQSEEELLNRIYVISQARLGQF